MPQSLDKRFNGNIAERQDFLDYVELHGDVKALTDWSEKLGGYKSYIGLRKWLFDQTKNPTFGLYPKIANIEPQTYNRQLIQEFADYAFRMRTLLNEKEQIIRELKKEIQLLKSRECLEVARLLEEFKT